MPFFQAAKPSPEEQQHDPLNLAGESCIFLPAARGFLKPGSHKPLSEAKTRKLEKIVRKIFHNAGIQPTRISVVYCQQPLILAELSDNSGVSARGKLVGKLGEPKYKGSAVAWLSKKSLTLFEKATEPCTVTSEIIPKQPVEDAASNGNEVAKVVYKTNIDLRGVATGILLKELPPKLKYGQLKRELPFIVKGQQLTKKSGKLNAILTFATPTECSAAFDALQSFMIEGHHVLPAFVRPRVKAAKPVITKNSASFCLNITNIPFSTTHEQLKEAFPTAENIVSRTRRDGIFKGSCIVSFGGLSDCKAVEEACHQTKIINGRKVVCSPCDPAEFTALVQSHGRTRGSGDGGTEKGDGGETEGTKQIKLFNLPYTTTEDELKAVFPNSRHIFFPKNKSGNVCGIAILSFKNPTICLTAMKKAEHLKLQERKIRAEFNVTVKRDGKNDAGNQSEEKKNNNCQQVHRPKKRMRQSKEVSNEPSKPKKSRLHVKTGADSDQDDDGWTATNS